MRRILPSLAIVAMLAASLSATPALAQQQSRSDQASAREQMQAGRAMPISEIERRIIPRMDGDEYIGFEYDPTAQAYRLKFIREGRVIWVDVDARTARILRVSR